MHYDSKQKSSPQPLLALRMWVHAVFRKHKFSIISTICLLSILSGLYGWFRKPAGSIAHIKHMTKEQMHQAQMSAKDAFVSYVNQLSSATDTQPSLLCHTIIMRSSDATLWKNIALAGGNCHWAITWVYRDAAKAHSTKDLAEHCLKHQSQLAFEQDYDPNHQYFNKAFVWKTLLPIIKDYSHIWLLDSDISFGAPANMPVLFEAWRCGSSAKFPPIISQPSIINREGESQSVKFLNHKPHLINLGLSVIKTEHCEIQAPIVATKFLSWLLTELIEPHIEPNPEFSLTDWGIDFMWCRAADFFQRSSNTHSSSMPTDGPEVNPSLSCALIPHPVVHFSTDTIQRSDAFLKSGETMLKIYRRKFPTMYKLERQTSPFDSFLNELSDEDLFPSSSSTSSYETHPSTCAAEHDVETYTFGPDKYEVSRLIH